MSGFSETLKRIRQSKGMSQEELADFLGTSKQNISRYESGEVSPKISTAAKIARKLGVSLSYLNGEEEAPSRAAGDLSINEIEFALSGEIRDLTDVEKQDILDYVRFKRAQKAKKDDT